MSKKEGGSFWGAFFKKTEQPKQEVIVEEQSFSKEQSTTPIVGVGQAGSTGVNYPLNFADVENLISGMRTDEKPILVDVTKVDEKMGQRFIDVLSGAVKALNGTVMHISGGLFFFQPKNR